MESIEMIYLRTFSDQERQTAVDIFNGLSIQGADMPFRIKLFMNHELPNDLMVFLYWNMAGRLPFKSLFGQRLSTAFKNLGWITHSVWESLREESANDSCLR